jgi:hypothetical protein
MRERKEFWMALCSGLLLLFPVHARADIPEAQARQILASAHRIIVISPFYGTQTLLSNPKEESKLSPKQLTQQRKYQEILQRLEKHAAHQLPVCTADRTAFTVIPESKVEAQLTADHFTPRDLFTDNGLLHGDTFPVPRVYTAQQLCSQLHADLILLSVLDEPRRVNGHYIYDLLGGLEQVPSHVNCRGVFYLLDAQGDTVYHGIYSVDQPLTTIAGHTYLFADWRDAVNILIEDFFDDLNRLLPDRSLSPKSSSPISTH